MPSNNYAVTTGMP